ncbi:Protein Dok-7, partial [Operophtera brumata]
MMQHFTLTVQKIVNGQARRRSLPVESAWKSVVKDKGIDCVHLQLYKDLKERQKNGQTKASLSLQQYLGFESGFTLDKESNTLAILCEDVVPVLAFDTREILIQWRVKGDPDTVASQGTVLGYESWFTLDKESNTLAILFEDVVPVLAFDTREILIQWRVKGDPDTVASQGTVLGYESWFTLDKESNTLAILCEDVVPVLAFDTREILIQWRVKVQHNLGSSKEFAAVIISSPSTNSIRAGPVRLHACGPRLALCGSRPPE